MSGASFVASPSSIRLWRVCKAAGRPWPVLDPDDVIDFMVMEAVEVNVLKDDQKRAKKQEREEWKRRAKEEMHRKQESKRDSG